MPERPFFLYLAFGAMHSPHQAPQSYLEKYRGQFDAGWDVVRERMVRAPEGHGGDPRRTPSSRRATRACGPGRNCRRNEQKFACRLQEAFAAMLDHTDAQIGRLVEFLKSVGQFDNTLFLVHVRQRRQPGGRRRSACSTR